MAFVARARRRKQVLWAGASAFAIALVLSLDASPALACTWAPEGDGIAVTCEDGDTASSFSTSYDSDSDSYDGSGADRITMDGGLIVGDDSFGTPTRDGDSDPLDFTGGSIFTNDGDDVLEMNAGQIGEEDGRVDIHFGDGDDQLQMNGGLLYGDVFGEGGSDTFTMTGGVIEGSLYSQAGGNFFDISGGTVTNFIFAGSEDDVVTISGDAEIRGDGAGPDAIGLEDGNDIFNLSGNASVGAAVSGGAGDDTFNISGGTIAGFLAGNDGDDVFNISGGTLEGGVFGNAGEDVFNISGGVIDIGVFGFEDDDTFDISGGTILGDVDGGLGNDQIAVSAGASITGDVIGGGGDDTIAVSGGFIEGSVLGEIGNDTIDISGGDIGGDIDGGLGNDDIAVSGNTLIRGDVIGGDGDDTIGMSGGQIDGSVLGQAGSDSIAISGGTIAGDVDGGLDDDEITISGTALIEGAVIGGDGDDSIAMTGGEILGSVFGGIGADTIDISGGSIGGDVDGGLGDDQIAVSGGASILGDVSGGDGDDSIEVSGGVIDGSVLGGGGSDTIGISGGRIVGNVDGGTGDDEITVSGTALIEGDVFGGGEADVVEMRGGEVRGGISAGTVRLFGGTVGGDISGLTANTLVIDDSAVPEALILQDGVTFSGTEAVGTITNTDLAAGGSQNFVGFQSVDMFNSTLRFADSTTQGIQQLTLAGGSTLFTGDNVTLNGSLALTDGSTLAAGTGFNIVDGLIINGATIVVDVDQDAGIANALNVGGTLTTLGDNTLLVNLLAAPATLQTVEIPVITAAEVEGPGTFTVAGIPGGAALLFDYQAIAGPDSVILLATPNADVVGLVTALDAASAAAAAENMTATLYGILWDVSAQELGLSPASSGGPVELAPNFGVFAAGQFARVNHGGFSVSNGGASFAGPSFSSNDFSAAVSFDFNMARHLGLDPQYGLNLGVFGGYASTDLTLDSFFGFNPSGWARNQSGMVGGYALMRQERNYLLVSGMGLFGNTDVRNQLLGGATGRYGTTGYAFTASAGRIFMLTDTIRFDMRGGALAASFRGEPYVDSLGLAHGASRVSFGALKLEPGIFADHVLENGMVFSPYLRGEIQQRIGYRNRASAGGLEFKFDDADLSASLSAGFNLRMSARSTLSAEIRGKASSDSTTFAGKVGLKIAF